MTERAGPSAPTIGAHASPPLVAPEASTARSSVFVSTSFLVSSVFGALLALLIAVIVGQGADTDGFLAAYSAYLTFILFGTTLRASLVPLFGATGDEGRFRDQAAAQLRSLLAAAGLACALLFLSSPLLGRVLVPSASSHAQRTAALSIAILALGAYCQIWSAMLSAVLGAARRFAASALFYVAASAVALGLGSALMAIIGIAGAAIGVLAGSAMLLAAHVGYLGKFGFAVWPAWRRLRDSATWRLAGLAAAGAAIPIALQLNATISLAAVSSETGAVTAYSYAYFLTVLATGVTAGVIALVTMPNLISAQAERGAAAGAEYLRETVPFAFFLYVPIAAGYAVFGRPFVDAVLLGPLTRENVDLLWDASRIFLLMGLSWTMLAPLAAVAMSRGMYARLAIIALGMVPLHAALVIPISSSGPVAVAWAHAAGGVIVICATLGAVFGSRALAAGWGAVRRSLPAIALGLVFPALGLAGLDNGLAEATVGLALGASAYVLLGVTLWRSVGGQALRLLRAR